jgi:hypothetical protein
VYDMYPWNDPDSGANHRQDEPAAAWLPEPREVPDPAGPAIRAVQFALDRRDNGGDAQAVAGQPSATHPAATQPTATQPTATQPTVGRTRQ